MANRDDNGEEPTPAAAPVEVETVATGGPSRAGSPQGLFVVDGEPEFPGCEDHPMQNADADCAACCHKYGVNPSTPGRRGLMHPNTLRRRFAPGTSGNPSGAKSGHLTMESVVRRRMNKIHEVGDTVLTTREAIVERVIAMAIRQNPPRWVIELLWSREWPELTAGEIERLPPQPVYQHFDIDEDWLNPDVTGEELRGSEAEADLLAEIEAMRRGAPKEPESGTPPATQESEADEAESAAEQAGPEPEDQAPPARAPGSFVNPLGGAED